jgi:ATP-binding cassette, subfamily B, bacterial
VALFPVLPIINSRRKHIGIAQSGKEIPFSDRQMSKDISLSTALKRGVAEIISAAPDQLRRLVFFNLLHGSGPVLVLYMQKYTIDYFVQSIAAQGVSASLSAIPIPVIVAAVLIVLVNVLLDSVETLNGFEFAGLRDRIQGHLRLRIFDVVSSFDDITLFENPELLNIKQAAQMAIPRLQQLAQIMGNMMTGVFVFIPVFILSFSIAWWIPLLIFASAIPSILYQMRYEDLAWSIEHSQVELNRKMGLYEQVLTSENYAKDVRMLGIQGRLLDHWNSIFQDALGAVTAVRRKGALVISAWSLLSGAGIGISFVYIFVSVARGQISVGDLALYSGLIFQMRRSLYILLGNSTSLREVALSSAALIKLFDMKPSAARSAAQPMSRGAASNALELREVSFRYPGAAADTIRSVNLAFKPNTLTVIVGENGAGKTTLSKLICKLYPVNGGAIIWNGQNIADIDTQAWRAQIGVVFQDFARFPMTVRQNIGFGDLAAIDHDSKLLDVLGRVGLDEAVAGMANRLETPLTKQEDSGTELSGGQWQRLAIARAMLRDASTEILLMDEPTAALDPNTEHQVYQLLKTLASGKIALIVSHRLGLARIADNIVVLAQGEIVEQGSHAELMAMQGTYHRMFVNQASSYVDSD